MRTITKWAFVVLFVIILSGVWMLQLSPFTYTGQAAEPLQGWMYRYGDSPIHERNTPAWTGAPESDGEVWRPIDKPYNPEGRNSRNILWLRTTVPAGEWLNPTLMLRMHEQFDIYTDDGMLLYRYGNAMLGEHSPYPAVSLRLISLPPKAAGHTLYFRVYSESSTIGLSGEALVGSKSDFLLNLFRQDLDDLLLGFFYFILGIAFLYIYFLFRNQKVFVAFAVFASSFGVYCASKTFSVHLLYDNPPFWTAIEAASLTLGIVGLLRFMEQMLEIGSKSYIGKIWRVHLAFALLASVCVMLGVIPYSLVQIAYMCVIIATMALILPKIFIYVRSAKGNAPLFLLGTLAMCAAGVTDMVNSLSNSNPTMPTVTTIGLAVLIVAIFLLLLRRFMELMLIARNSEKLSMVSQLAAGVAHEIRNPLSVISGFVQLLKKDPSHYKYLDLISSEIDRMNGIVGDFLLFSKPSRETLSKRHVGDILKETLDLFKADMMNKCITLDFRVEENLLPVNCDANQLKQVFMNIIKNGIESMHENGKLTVTVESEGRRKIRIRIVDQGVGIPPEELPNIGQPFYTTKERGTGLGLMISVKYLEHHGGTLQIRSKVNVGTTVDIVLPTYMQLFMANDISMF